MVIGDQDTPGHCPIHRYSGTWIGAGMRTPI